MEQRDKGRKTILVRAHFGRDDGKVYQLTEWYAERAERWAVGALLAFNRGGGDLPIDRVMGQGMAGVFALGMQTFLRGQMRADEVTPILDELLQCVKIVRDEKKRDAAGQIIATDITHPEDIAEVQTRLWLRSEVFRLHTGFSPADALSNLISLVMKETAPAEISKTG